MTEVVSDVLSQKQSTEKSGRACFIPALVDVKTRVVAFFFIVLLVGSSLHHFRGRTFKPTPAGVTSSCEGPCGDSKSHRSS